MSDVADDRAGLAARKAALSILSQVLRQRRPLDSQLDSLKIMTTNRNSTATAPT